MVTPATYPQWSGFLSLLYKVLHCTCTYTVLSPHKTPISSEPGGGVVTWREEGFSHRDSTVYIQLFDEKGYTVGRNNQRCFLYGSEV